MDVVISLLFLWTLAQHLPPVAPLETSLRAFVESVLGDSRIFSGEEVRLKCSVPDLYDFKWHYQWFKGSEKLAQSGEHLILWNIKVKDSGKYYCKGARDSLVGNIYTLQSLPVEIQVDGGWAILQVPPQHGLVGQTLMFTCQVRGKPPIHEMILYKDNVEVMTQKGFNPHFHLNNLTLEDQGMYSCRASWDADRRTHSVISAEVSVQVLEVLTQPILEIVEEAHLKMRLICHLQYNAHPPAPPINYYFYKNNNRLGTATSENRFLVKQKPGHYSCKAKVPQLGISRLSEPKSFGQVTGRPTMPPFLQPRNPRPFVPPVSFPVQRSFYQASPAPGSEISPAQSVNHNVPPSRNEPVTWPPEDMLDYYDDMSPTPVIH